MEQNEILTFVEFGIESRLSACINIRLGNRRRRKEKRVGAAIRLNGK